MRASLTLLPAMLTSCWALRVAASARQREPLEGRGNDEPARPPYSDALGQTMGERAIDRFFGQLAVVHPGSFVALPFIIAAARDIPESEQRPGRLDHRKATT
jgi:hypothetical protein